MITNSVCKREASNVWRHRFICYLSNINELCAVIGLPASSVVAFNIISVKTVVCHADMTTSWWQRECIDAHE